MLKHIFGLILLICTVSVVVSSAKEVTHMDLDLLHSIMQSTWLTPTEKIHAVSFFKDVIYVNSPEGLDFTPVTDKLALDDRPEATQEELDAFHDLFPTTCRIVLEPLACDSSEDNGCLCIFDYTPPNATPSPPPVTSEPVEDLDQ